jgi:hypothetical protein
MIKYLQIAGDPKNGIAVLTDDGVVHNLPSITPPSDWGTSISCGKPTGYASLSKTGEITTLAQSHSIQFLPLLGNPRTGWKTIQPPLPHGLALGAVTGDPIGGYTLVSAGGKSLHQIGADGKEWMHLSTTLPFTVSKIAGNAKDGLLLISDQDPSALARSGTDVSTWHKYNLEELIQIEFITGDFANGFVVYGDGQLYTMTLDADLTKPPLLHPVLTPGFTFSALSGNPKDGVAALISDTSEDGKLVVYATDVTTGLWNLALVPRTEPNAP